MHQPTGRKFSYRCAYNNLPLNNTNTTPRPKAADTLHLHNGTQVDNSPPLQSLLVAQRLQCGYKVTAAPQLKAPSWTPHTTTRAVSIPKQQAQEQFRPQQHNPAEFLNSELAHYPPNPWPSNYCTSPPTHCPFILMGLLPTAPHTQGPYCTLLFAHIDFTVFNIYSICI